MNVIGADTDRAQQIGRAVHDREPAATAAATSLLNSYDDAAATVVHPKMSASLTAYRDANQRGHLQLAREIQRLGSNTASGGAGLADAQNESTNVQQQSCGTGQSLSQQVAEPLQP